MQALALVESVMADYHILGRIGEGAHGIVLKAKHIQVIQEPLSMPSI